MNTTIMRPMGWGHDARITAADDFKSFVAFALSQCWLSGNPDDVNDNCNFSRPVTTDDVNDLRMNLLNVIETATAGIWTGNHNPGDGYLDIEGTTTIDEETYAQWIVRLDQDAIMVELAVSGCDSTALWLNYDALNDRQNVVKVLQEAATHVPGHNVWDRFVTLAG